MSKIVIYFGIFMSIVSCSSKSEVDLIVFNGNIYTVNEGFDTIEAFAVNNGKFIDTGTTEQIFSKYTALDIIDAQEQTIVPGLIDAHAHFVGYALNLLRVNLVGTTSWEQILEKLQTFSKENPTDYFIQKGFKTIIPYKNMIL